VVFHLREVEKNRPLLRGRSPIRAQPRCESDYDAAAIPVRSRGSGRPQSPNAIVVAANAFGDATIVPLHFKVWGHYCESGEEILRDCCYDTDAQNLA